MSISSISSISALGGYDYAASAYVPQPSAAPSSNTRSTVTQLANGATVTTVRGTTGDVLAVSTASAAAKPVSSYSLAALPEASSFYATA